MHEVWITNGNGTDSFIVGDLSRAEALIVKGNIEHGIDDVHAWVKPERPAALRYRKRPVEIEAIRWTGDNFDYLELWCGDHVKRNAEGALRLFVAANTAWLELSIGEWIAKDRHGFYPIKDDVFLDSYEPVHGLTEGIDVAPRTAWAANQYA